MEKGGLETRRPGDPRVAAIAPYGCTLKSRMAGVRSTLPARSIARTLNRCAPLPRPEYAFGELQAANEAPSSLHWKWEPASEDEKLKLASC